MTKTQKKRQQYHNGRPESAAQKHSETFVSRVKHIITRDFFVDEFIKALGKHNIGVVFENNTMNFVQYETEKPPSYEELATKLRELQEKLRETEQ